MADYALSVTFPDNSKTFEAFSTLTNSADTYGIYSAALVARDANGAVSVPESYNPKEGSGLTDGGLIGALIGILGGPLGVLFGWGIGSLWGSSDDLADAESRDAALSDLARTVPKGGNAIFAVADDRHADAVDTQVGSLGGTVVRQPLEEVLEEIAAHEDAQVAATEAAAAKAREQRHEEKKQERHDKVDKLKQKLHL